MRDVARGAKRDAGHANRVACRLFSSALVTCTEVRGSFIGRSHAQSVAHDTLSEAYETAPRGRGPS
jgi:hypothetical protein